MGISLHGANTDRVKKIIEVVSQLHGPTLISKGPVDVISDAKSTVVCGTSAGWWIRQGAKHTISGQKVAGGINGSWLQPIKLLWCPAAGARRCGSQGDILSGVMSVFVSWTRSFMAEAAKSGELVLPELNHMVLAAFGACNVTRQVHQAPVCDSLGLMLSSSGLLAWYDLCAICPLVRTVSHTHLHLCRTACVCAFAVKRRSMLASDVLEQLGPAVEMLESSGGSNGTTGQAAPVRSQV